MLSIRKSNVAAFIVALSIAGALPGGRASGTVRGADREPWQTDLIDLDGPSLVREAFNADVGWPRLLLTFSPT